MESVLSGNIAVVVLGFTCLFLHSMYSGFLLSRMFDTRNQPAFTGMRTLAPLIADGTKTLVDVMPDSGWYMQNVKNATSEPYSLMKKALELNPVVIVTEQTRKAVLDALEIDSQLVYPETEMDAINLLTDRCDLIFVPDADVSELWAAALFQKDSELTTLVKGAMRSLVDHMVYIGDKYVKYMEDNNKCYDEAKNLYQIGQDPLQLKHYQGVLVVLVTGWIMGIALILAELIYWRLTIKLNKAMVY